MIERRTYYGELCRAMTMLATEHRAVFLGQSVVAGGTGMTATFADVPATQKIELPVMEDAQLGICTGLAIDGALPVCVYPRINFLLLAMSQLVLHLDWLGRATGYKPKVIIRTMVAHDQPLDPGQQHLGDYSDALADALRWVRVVRLSDPGLIVERYDWAAKQERPSIMIEYAALYGEEV